jgi:hypothetical protein
MNFSSGIADASREVGRETMTLHLLEAIDQVCEDAVKVELWAAALNGCLRPVPEYDAGQINVWVPGEQASSLKRYA